MEDGPHPQPLVRPAQAPDAPAIAEIWMRGWHDGHDGHVPRTLSDARTPASFAQRAPERIADAHVAVVDGTVAGFVIVVGDEVEQVYVAGPHRGTGVAPLLLETARRLVGAGGHERAWLAVAAGNARARRFYAREGWTDEGAFTYEAEGPEGPIAVPTHRFSVATGRTAMSGGVTG